MASSGRRPGKFVVLWSLAMAVIVGLVVAVVVSRSGTHAPFAYPAGSSSKEIKACETEYPSSPLVDGKSILSQHIRYIATKHDPSTAVTKFGGQPHWVSAPQWPLSRSTGKQMTFVGQVVLDRTTFPGAKGKIAYLFVADFDTSNPYAEPWNPDAGENAVIIQPGGKLSVDVANDRTGPTSQTSVPDPSTGKSVDKPVVYRVSVSPHVDQPFISDTAITKLSVTKQDRYFSSLDGDKIGGTPAFIQPAEFPCTANRLLLQIEDPPFSINLGDAGDGYAYINDDGTAGKFLSQSH